ncbi:cytochrome d ubiquinol oxidase subunit II [Pseudomarimonas arenosa]|uniref:Cytochrome d ubiquinol oxidase subunit II n=1 Tax=Pseudomarimonas arenosa TaxID=2774145 RepID=A0AAW3ZR28_9GAMM|nr:cytochrome d ubiquinol oxidase subunit II [Pseudomarimonas arenosa]MBD8527929.1 cytochrome d ubiquinol oxidase subunit II [Pseudomarimonas arenosa]
MDEMLPLIFVVLMGLSMWLYVLLDGYDLGVGMLFVAVQPGAERDRMIASIGPFWDANETWLVLGVGLLLVAFPTAHGIILGALYLPVAIMLVGLILRGVAFDFRVKAQDSMKALWDRLFFAGSLIASLAQGWMLGSYVTGFRDDALGLAFSALIAACVAAAYLLLGAGWVMLKASRSLTDFARMWARRALWGTALGIAAVSIATPLVSERIYDKWFQLPELLFLLPLPLGCAVLVMLADRHLRHAGTNRDWWPFATAVALLTLCFTGLAYSLFPYLVIDQLTLWQAAASPATLKIILVGAAITLPFILGYTVFVYRVFWGRQEGLSYE